MPLDVRYMGTKRAIAPSVAKIISEGPEGPLLDLFSGVCAIGSAVAPERQVWSNDSQIFSTTVASAFFTSPEMPPSFDEAAESALPYFKENKSELEARYARLLSQESSALKSCTVDAVSRLENKIPHAASSRRRETERASLQCNPAQFPYRLFCISFAGGYVGLRQAVEVDSIRYAIDRLLSEQRLTDCAHRWLVLALCKAVNKVSTTTGHFAQYLSIKEATAKRFVAQRIRSVWREWLKAIFELFPIGSARWRKKNRVFQKDASALMSDLKKKKNRPSVIYADPPYTEDQYSRYYHLYETLILYDYPKISGKGRCRQDRFVSDFSLKSKVKDAMENLISGCAKLGSSLVLSYPEDGLLSDAPDQLSGLIDTHFGSKPKIWRFNHLHSSMGASKGRDKYAVNELVFAVGW